MVSQGSVFSQWSSSSSGLGGVHDSALLMKLLLLLLLESELDGQDDESAELNDAERDDDDDALCSAEPLPGGELGSIEEDNELLLLLLFETELDNLDAENDELDHDARARAR